MENEELIERLEDIIKLLKDDEREQAESDFADLYEDIQNNYDSFDEEEEEEEEDYDEDDDYEEEDDE
jgi:hypothetical protein